jgi:ribosome-associated protein
MRHGTFGRVAAPDEPLRVSRSCVIPPGELLWRFTASGGPGGQHANTANTRVELVFDVAGSEALGPRQKARLLDKLGPVVRVVASDERSQARNRSLALERLASRLADALKVETPRRPTRPTKASKERRLEDKRRRAEIKQQRQQRNWRA